MNCLHLLNRSLGGCNRAGLKCFAEETNLLDLLKVKQQCLSNPACNIVTVMVCLCLHDIFLNISKQPAGRIFTIYFDFYELLLKLKPSHMK